MLTSNFKFLEGVDEDLSNLQASAPTMLQPYIMETMEEKENLAK